MQRERIERAVRALAAYDFGESTSPLFELDRLINESHGDVKARSSIERELAKLLASETSLAAKQEVCRRLWRIGTDSSLDALQPMLEADDPHVVAAACYAIGRRASARVDDMLMAAVRKAPSPCRPALEHLIEDRR